MCFGFFKIFNGSARPWRTENYADYIGHIKLVFVYFVTQGGESSWAICSKVFGHMLPGYFCKARLSRRCKGHSGKRILIWVGGEGRVCRHLVAAGLVLCFWKCMFVSLFSSISAILN